MASAKYKLNSRGFYETKVWDGTYTASGAKHRKTISSKKSSADLERKVAAFKRQLEIEGAAELNISFGEYSHRWFEIYKKTKELNTQKMYRSCVFTYLAPLDHLLLSNLRHSDFQEIINDNMDHPKTCKNIKQTFGQIIRAAVRDHYLPASAIEELTMDISLPKYQKPIKRPLTPLERRCVFEADLDDRKRAFVSILYYCGLRRGEALALSSGDFNWNNNSVKINKVIVFDNNKPILKPYPKSDNGIRSVPLPEKAVAVLKPYVQNCKGRLFRGVDKPFMTETAYKRMWESIVNSMNVAAGYNPQKKKDRGEKPIQGLTAHVFRHNYCSMLCYQIPSISTKKIAQLMGDTEKVVLDVYSHMLDEKEDVNSAINNAF